MFAQKAVMYSPVQNMDSQNIWRECTFFID